MKIIDDFPIYVCSVPVEQGILWNGRARTGCARADRKGGGRFGAPLSACVPRGLGAASAPAPRASLGPFFVRRALGSSFLEAATHPSSWDSRALSKPDSWC